MFGVWNKGSPGQPDGTVERPLEIDLFTDKFQILVLFRGYLPNNFHLGILKEIRIALIVLAWI